MTNEHSRITEHQALWKACVDSGFTESRWWPQSGLNTPLVWMDRPGSWYWARAREQVSPTPLGWSAGPNAILAGLIEWATTDGRFVRYASERVAIVKTRDMPGEMREASTDTTTALLACFKQWREAQ